MALINCVFTGELDSCYISILTHRLYRYMTNTFLTPPHCSTNSNDNNSFSYVCLNLQPISVQEGGKKLLNIHTAAKRTSPVLRRETYMAWHIPINVTQWEVTVNVSTKALTSAKHAITVVQQVSNLHTE